MRLITSNTNKFEYPKRHICENCGAELEYDKADVHVGWMGCEYVTCPNCDSETMVSESRVQPPTWNTTFRHNSADTCVDVEDTKIQEYVDQAMKILSSNDYKDGDFYVLTTGNLMVLGWKHDEGEIDIFVSKDYWEDSIEPEDY